MRGYNNTTKKPNNWKGGKYKHSSGYLMVLRRDHHRANKQGYVYEHILIMEKIIGRDLEEGELIHHIDCDSSNNNPENLYLSSKRKHKLIHNKFGHMTGELFKRGIIKFNKEQGDYYL